MQVLKYKEKDLSNKAYNMTMQSGVCENWISRGKSFILSVWQELEVGFSHLSVDQHHQSKVLFGEL